MIERLKRDKRKWIRLQYFFTLYTDFHYKVQGLEKKKSRFPPITFSIDL